VLLLDLAAVGLIDTLDGLDSFFVFLQPLLTHLQRIHLLGLIIRFFFLRSWLGTYLCRSVDLFGWMFDYIWLRLCRVKTELMRFFIGQVLHVLLIVGGVLIKVQDVEEERGFLALSATERSQEEGIVFVCEGEGECEFAVEYEVVVVEQSEKVVLLVVVVVDCTLVLQPQSVSPSLYLVNHVLSQKPQVSHLFLQLTLPILHLLLIQLSQCPSQSLQTLLSCLDSRGDAVIVRGLLLHKFLLVEEILWGAGSGYEEGKQ
jgi:hypothetical protein